MRQHLHSIFEMLSISWQIVRRRCRCCFAPRETGRSQ
jgi:hypothetical protein